MTTLHKRGAQPNGIQLLQGTMLHLWRVIPIPKLCCALTFASTQIKQAKYNSCEN